MSSDTIYTFVILGAVLIDLYLLWSLTRSQQREAGLRRRIDFLHKEYEGILSEVKDERDLREIHLQNRDRGEIFKQSGRFFKLVSKELTFYRMDNDLKSPHAVEFIAEHKMTAYPMEDA